MFCEAYDCSQYTGKLLMLLWMCVWLRMLSSLCLISCVCIFYLTRGSKDIDWLMDWMMMMYHQTKFGCKWFRRYHLDLLNLCFDLDLEHSEAIFSQHILAYDDVHQTKLGHERIILTLGLNPTLHTWRGYVAWCSASQQVFVCWTG